jgi:hypothetical protein
MNEYDKKNLIKVLGGLIQAHVEGISMPWLYRVLDDLIKVDDEE